MANSRGCDAKTGLSTTRINRFLRPLRSRCSALAAYDYAQATPATGRTYSSAKSFNFPDIPPLLILPSPDNAATRFDASSYELSRKIYAVRSAFKEIVDKTREVRLLAQGNSSTRIPSLSTLCSFVIGEHAEPDVDDAATRAEEEQALDVVDSLYDVVPSLYRGSTLVSHAIHIILEVCPFIPTLLKLLLDITLDDSLHYHSEILTRALLSVALTPHSPTRPPPVCHAAHSNFFLDIRNHWEKCDIPSSAFLRVFSEAMAQASSYDAWSCKATAKLLLHDGRKDPLRVVSLSCELVRFIANTKLHVPSRQTISCSLSPSRTLRRSLQAWLECTLHHLLSSEQTDYDCIYDFLRACQDCRVHIVAPDVTSTAISSPEQDTSSAIACIATLLLSRRRDSRDAEVVQLLKDIGPVTATYQLLLSQAIVCFIRVQECSKHIQTYASTLRAHSLLSLEVSLWASALRELEKADCSLQRCDKDALNNYRLLLMDCIQDAERRCFGSPDDCLAPITNSPLAVQQRRARAWDTTLGCWTSTASVDSSSHKRRRRSSSRLPRSYDKESACCSCSDSYACSHSDNLDTSNCSSKKRPRLSHSRISSFSSLLSNALSNRTVLHFDNNVGVSNDYGEAIIFGEQEERAVPDADADHYPEDIAFAIPSSDDGLDLFACPPSSPAR